MAIVQTICYSTSAWVGDEYTIYCGSLSPDQSVVGHVGLLALVC